MKEVKNEISKKQEQGTQVMSLDSLIMEIKKQQDQEEYNDTRIIKSSKLEQPRP